MVTAEGGNAIIQRTAQTLTAPISRGKWTIRLIENPLDCWKT